MVSMKKPVGVPMVTSQRLSLTPSPQFYPCALAGDGDPAPENAKLSRLNGNIGSESPQD
jgi:hypothetical protein